MKFTKILKSFFCAMFAIIFIFSGTLASYAATQTYSFSDLDIEVKVPSELAVFTRNVTSADKNLKLVNTTADELRIMFAQYAIYLEAIPTDVSYEIVVSGKDVSKDTKDLNTLNDSELNEGLQAYKEKCESVSTDEIMNITTYKNNSTVFYQVDFKTLSNDVTVYARKYYTVMQGKELNFTVQSKTNEVTDEQVNQLKSVVDSTVYKQIDQSITESPVFTELAGYIIGILITVVVLGGIALLLKASTKKQKY